MHGSKDFGPSLLIVCFLLWVTPAQAVERACASLAKLIDDHHVGANFLVSFPRVTSGPLNGVGFTYDNALAVIAMIGCGNTQKATIIANAFLHALDHDRYWHDGRLRNAYLAGAARDTPLKLPGWWDQNQKMWVEDQYQVGSDTGNQAWTMLALVALYQVGEDTQYLTGAERIGSYVEKSFDIRAPAGFSGGTFGDKPLPVQNTWKSTEHNTDLSAAFTRLAQTTGNSHWRIRAQEAQNFVSAMWKRSCECFAAGTTADGQTANPYLVLDANVWPLLAVAGYTQRFGSVIQTIKKRLKDREGFSYSQSKEGIWTEGTAQVALLYELLNQGQSARSLLRAIERNRSPDDSYYAAGRAEMPTGFTLETDPQKPRLYFHLSHLAALCWAALAQQKFNPFTGSHDLPRLSK